jgi:hypothetical protein
MAAPATDITGYRSDAGGLGQDQGISKNLKNILTAKLPLLSSPGTLLENTLYYDINSSSIVAVEQQATFAKDRIVLNNFSMDASPSAYIPSVLFAGTVFWIAKLNQGAHWPTTYAQDASNAFVAPHGWGFAALNQVIVYMGASTIAQIQISSMTNYLVNAATCETANKRKIMLDGAGRYLNPIDPRSIMAQGESASGSPTKVDAPFWRLNHYGDYYTTDSNGSKAYFPAMSQCCVPIRLPWSSMAALDKRLSLDCKLSTQPIQITLYGNGPTDFLTMGSNVQAQIGTSWDSSTIQLWQEELSDKSLSVRNELLAMPEFNVGYPFQYAQSIPFDIIAPSDDGLSTKEFVMNITSIINSDLTTFLFNVTWSGRTEPQNGQCCPLYGELLTDITLLLNGQRFFHFDEDAYQFVTLAKQLDDPNQSGMIMPSTNVAFPPASAQTSAGFIVSGNIYEFNNSRLRSIISEANLQNTARFTNQTFQLSFKINRDLYYLTADPTTASSSTYATGVSKKNGYRLNMTYLYNAVFMIGGDGGTTKLITN